MRSPKAQGAPIDARRIQQWLASYGTYWDPPTRGSFESWLDQFGQRRDMAARILDSVLFIGQAHVTQAFRELANSLDGWNIDEHKRVGNWRFVAFSGSAGESGDTMLHNFRLANGLGQRKYNSLFCTRSEILSQGLTSDDTLVLVDDFSGSGKQACDSWTEFFSELVADGPKVVLMLIAATTVARNKIQNETDMTLAHSRSLSVSDNIFDEACHHFTQEEKTALLRICRTADSRKPKGFGECGLLLVFYHRCPNNSIPVLHARNENWEPIFQRHE